MDSAYGFTADELEAPNKITALVSTWQEPPPYRNYRLSTYGVVYAGQGREGLLWGGGPSSFHIPTIAAAVERLVTLTTPGTELTIYLDREFIDYVGPNGHARIWPDGYKPYLPALRRAMRALDGGIWAWRDKKHLRKRHAGKAMAKAMARSDAYLAAYRHREAVREKPAMFTITVEGPSGD